MILFLFRKSWNILLKNPYHDRFRLSLVFFLNVSKNFLKRLFLFAHFYFWEVLSIHIYWNCRLLLKRIYILYCFEDRKLLGLIYLSFMCRQHDKRQFCFWYNFVLVLWNKISFINILVVFWLFYELGVFNISNACVRSSNFLLSSSTCSLYTFLS